MIETTLQSLLNTASAFMGETVPAVAKIERGAGAVASILFTIAAAGDTALGEVRGKAAFEALKLPTIAATGVLHQTLSTLKSYLNRQFSKLYLADFSPIFGTSDGGELLGATKGKLAGSVRNTVEWASTLKELSIHENYADIIAFRTRGDSIPLAVDTGDAPFQVDDDIATRIEDLLETAREAETELGIASVFEKLESLLSSVSFDATKIPNDQEDFSPYLKVPSGYKWVAVEAGESLQSIALRELGDADLWRQIAYFNDFVIESPEKILIPRATFEIASDLSPGESTFDYGEAIPTDYIAQGCTLGLKDSSGNRQSVRVKSIEGSLVTIFGTFSQYLFAPIAVTRYDALSALGRFDFETELSETSSVGARKLYLDAVKDIFPGCSVLVAKGDATQAFSVTGVNYIEGSVDVSEPSTGFPDGASAKVFDSEGRLFHLEPGTRIKIPGIGGGSGRGAAVQSDADVFGIDIALDDSGRLLLDGGDFATVSGLQNFRQAILHRIASPLGSIVFHPEYGCGLWSIIGEKSSPYFSTLSRATVVDALNREPRVSRIARLIQRVEGDAVHITAEVNPVEEDTPEDLNFVVRI